MGVHIKNSLFSSDFAAKSIIALMLIFNIYPLIDYCQYLFLGNVYIKINYLKVFGIIMFFVWVLSIIYKGSFKFLPYLGRYHLLYAVYCFISAILAIRFGYSIKYITMCFASSVLWFTLMLPFSILHPYSSLTHNNKNNIYNMISIVIITSFFLAFILGALQHFLNDPILPLKLFLNSESELPYFIVMSYDFFGRVRAFGFFDQPIGLGLLSTLVANIALSKLLFKRFSLISVMLLIAGVFCVYITYLRMCYITLSLSLLVIAYIWACKKLNKHFLNYTFIYLPFVLLFLVFVLIMYGYINLVLENTLTFSSGTIFDLNSMIARYIFWSDHINTYIINGKFIDIMFGYGIFQGVRLENADIIVDNSYLMAIIYQGVFGLLMILLFYYKLWCAISQICLKTLHPFEIAVASYLSSFLATAMYANIMFWHNIFFFLLPLIVVRANYDIKSYENRITNL